MSNVGTGHGTFMQTSIKFGILNKFKNLKVKIRNEKLKFGKL